MVRSEFSGSENVAQAAIILAILKVKKKSDKKKFTKNKKIINFIQIIIF